MNVQYQITLNKIPISYKHDSKKNFLKTNPEKYYLLRNRKSWFQNKGELYKHKQIHPILRVRNSSE